MKRELLVVFFLGGDAYVLMMQIGLAIHGGQ
jgi:hypothetical protein